MKTKVRVSASPGDSTADLDYTSPFALELPENDTTALGAAATMINSSAILRASTNPSQNVSLVLPTNGRPGSLGASGDLWIEVQYMHRGDIIEKHAFWRHGFRSASFSRGASALKKDWWAVVKTRQGERQCLRVKAK